MLIRGSDVVDSCVGDGEPDGDAEQERGNDPADYSNEDRVLLHVCSPALAEGSRAVSGGHGGYPPGVYLLQPADAAEVPRNFRAGSRFIHCEMTIGRASCRERVCQSVSITVAAVSIKKKHQNTI